MDIANNFIFPLSLTIILELIMLLILKEKNIKIYIVSFFINILTNLMLSLFIYNYNFINILHYFIIIIILELLIWTVEGLFYYVFTNKIKKSIVYALLCNLFSFIVGYIIQFLFNI